jgi:hypothetical protein
VNELWPESEQGSYTFVVAWIDLDRDGFMDLYLANDRGWSEVPNRYFRNVDGLGTFEDWSDPTLTGIALGAMGIGLGDVNDDGDADLAITNWGPMKLLESFGDGTWYQSESARGLRTLGAEGSNATWGLEFQDLDHDMDLDLPINAGSIMTVEGPTNPLDQNNSLMIQGDDGVFVNEHHEWGWDDIGNHRGLVVTDMDGNGWLDLVARDMNGSATIAYQRCGPESWATVRFQSTTGMNRFGIGARVEIEAGGVTQRRWMVAGGTSFVASAPAVVHFGLADLTTIDRVRVIWPDASVTEFPGPIAANQHLIVDRR